MAASSCWLTHVPRSVEALVEPELLSWARTTAGLDPVEAARKVAVDVERLTSWETGERRPTIPQLRNLARVYRRPLAAFYLPEPPPDLRPPKDFRRLPGEVAGVESPELRYELRRAVARRDFALELLAANDEEPPSLVIEATPIDSSERLGSEIRNYLGITLAQQFRWRPPYGPFNAWRDAIESVGALVTQLTDIEVSEARGFSISDRPLPVIAVNIKDSPNGRTFSLLHEFVHWILRQGGLCDLEDEQERPWELLRIERFCNRTAADTLMPKSAFLSQSAVTNHGANIEWSDLELQQVARRFGVSREAVLRRLLDLGRTSQDHYQEWHEVFQAEYRRAREGRSPGFAPPAQMALASAGPTFAGLVVNSYQRGTITAGDVSNALAIRLKHLPTIERRLRMDTVAREI